MKLFTAIGCLANILMVYATVTNTTQATPAVLASTVVAAATTVEATVTTLPMTVTKAKPASSITKLHIVLPTEPVLLPINSPEKPSPPKRAIASSDGAAAKANAVSITTKKPKSINGTDPMDKYECPQTETFQLFPTACTKHGECITNMGTDHRCCKQYGSRRCVKASARSIPEPKHSPLLGLIPRKCPKEPLAELFWQLQTCDSDQDCWPRICCPDGVQKYCRTSTPELEKSNLRVAKQLASPLESASQYIQCTPPPPGAFDKFPKKCNTTLDCFPNVCCQEEGKKHCRPPRRSLLALMTGFASNFNVFRRFTSIN